MFGQGGSQNLLQKQVKPLTTAGDNFIKLYLFIHVLGKYKELFRPSKT